MNYLKKISFRTVFASLAIIGSLITIPQAQAQTFPDCNSGSCRGFVGRVLFDSAGQLFISIDGANIGALTSCTATNGLARVPSTDPNQKSLYALALTAFSLQEPVQVAIKTGSPTCDVAFMNMFTQ